MLDMMYKKLFILLLVLPLGVFAQKSKPWNKPLYDAYKWHYGFAFSAGVLDFSVKHADYINESDSVFSVEGLPKAVFGASMVGNLKLSPSLDLRFLPGLFFGQRNLDYFIIDNISGMDTTFRNHQMKIESTLLQFPFLVKYRSTRENNYRPYIVFGSSYSLDLASRKKIREEEQPKIRLNRQDVYLEIGAGLDYYLPFFKFSTELRFSYGLLNVVNYDGKEYTKIFDRLGSKMLTLSIYFE